MTPRISVITPTNSARWYDQAKKSMIRQVFTEWEWIVLWNGDALQPAEELDPRIRHFRSAMGLSYVGALKREACLHATAPFIVEFDHDDEMSADCLAAVAAVFDANPEAVFVYSNDAQVRTDGSIHQYREDYGWKLKPQAFLGEEVETISAYERPMLLPQNVSRIWFAPDHVRAWRANAYWMVGGHDASLSVCDDQDMMCRLLTGFPHGFRHIDGLLYKHRVHGENTWLQKSGVIQELTIKLHDRYIQDMALSFWRARGLECVDLGGGINSPKGWTSCDRHDAAITADLDAKWPFPDHSVGAFRAHDVIEHLRDPIHTMNEAWRCLTHGGILLIEVPSTDGRGAFQDPTHVSFYNSNAFWYWTRSAQQNYIRHAGAVARFQVVRIADHFPSEWHRDNRIPYVRAHLAAIKDGPRLHGPIEI